MATFTVRIVEGPSINNTVEKTLRKVKQEEVDGFVKAALLDNCTIIHIYRDRESA